MGNKGLIYVVLAVLIVGAIYFFFFQDNNTTTTTPTPTEDTTQQQDTDSSSMTVTLDALSDSDQSGVATLTEEDGQTRVVLNVDNAPEGVQQPAHIHTGACPDVGDVVYPLNNVVDGASDTLLDVDMQTLNEELPLAINVHLSPEEISTYVSCGDL